MSALRTSVVVFSALGLAFAGACSGGSTPDAGVPDTGTPDAGNPDGGSDAGGPVGLSAYCNSGSGPTCLSPWACANFGGNGGYCSAHCDPDAGACADGGACLPVGSAPLCVLTCAATNDCPADDVCATTTAGNYCLPDCRTHAGLCGRGSACDTSLGFCTASGSQTFGERCSGTYGVCAAGLTCVEVQTGATYGLCTTTCTTQNPCPTQPAGAGCILPAQGGVYYCGWGCTLQADGGPFDAGECPPALSCQVTAGAPTCL